MSKATKRKHVTREVLEEYVLPEEHQQIVKVVAPRGNNLHEVQASSGDKFLASMPTKFRKNVWIKRGDCVIVDPIEEGDKVKAEIVVILYPKQIKYIEKEGLWPKEFVRGNNQLPVNGTLAEVTEKLGKTSLKTPNDEEGDDDNSEEEESDNDDDLFINTNRPPVVYYSSSEESSSEEEEEGEGDEHNLSIEGEDCSVDH